MEYKIEIYQTDMGKRPFSQWLKDIKDHLAKAKIRLRLDRLEMSNFGQCEPVGEGVFELKIDFGPGFECIEESLLGDEKSQEILLNALRNVAEAQGGLGKLAKKTHVRREVLYRVLSSEGNPELRTFASLVHAMGLNLRFC